MSTRWGGGFEHWLVGRADLDPHYDRVEKMLGAQTFPLGAPGYPSPPKTLAMRDAAAALELEWGLPPLEIDWTTATSRSFFERLRGTMQALAGELGGDLVDNPLSLINKVVTVHPLGGAPMGRNVSESVVDQWGESFAYPSLHVLDGSVMPGPVGANPSLTLGHLLAFVGEHRPGDAADHEVQGQAVTMIRYRPSLSTLKHFVGSCAVLMAQTLPPQPLRSRMGVRSMSGGSDHFWSARRARAAWRPGVPAMPPVGLVPAPEM